MARRSVNQASKNQSVDRSYEVGRTECRAIDSPMSLFNGFSVASVLCVPVVSGAGHIVHGGVNSYVTQGCLYTPPVYPLVGGFLHTHMGACHLCSVASAGL